MNVVCTAHLTSLIRKHIEVMYSGSEYGSFCFRDDNMQIQTVDSLSVCVCMLEIKKTIFCRYILPNDIFVKFNIRSFLNSIKGSESPSSLMMFGFDGGCLTVSIRNGSEDIFENLNHITTKTENNDNGTCYLLGSSIDTTTYYSIPSSPSECPCYTMHVSDFTCTVLDLAVGGGHIQIEMKGTQTKWSTYFETGQLTIQMDLNTNKGKYGIIRPATRGYSHVYLTKFLKHTCNLASLYTNVRINLLPDGLIMIELESVLGIRTVVVLLPTI
jgi:hypothetical protein